MSEWLLVGRLVVGGSVVGEFNKTRFIIPIACDVQKLFYYIM